MTTRRDSPCIAICDVLYRDICTGCGRTFTEVYEWNGMTEQAKDVVWERIETERTALRYTERYKDRI